MRKLTTFFAVLFLAVTLTACGSKPKLASELVQAAEGHTIYNGTGFAFSYDPAAWSNMAPALEGVGDAAAELGVDISDEQAMEMNDGVFVYSADPAVNFNIVVNDGGHTGKKVDYEAVAQQMESQYGVVQGMDYLGYEVKEINGYSYLKLDLKLSSAVFGVGMKMTQYAFFTDDKNYVITFTAADGSYDKAVAEFEKVLATFVYDEK